MAKLKRELSLFQVTVAGVGIILGAGIYALIGVASGVAGNAVWLSFLITAIVAIFTGLSYAELTTMFKGDAGEYSYIKTAFNKHYALIVGLSMIFAGFVSAAAVALGFGAYLGSLLNIPVLLGAILLVLAMSFINYRGISDSSKFNTISTFIEFIGLVIIIILGLTRFGSVNYWEMPQGLHGVFSSAALVFFAYMGFESIIKLTEETKNPEKTMPKAIIYSILITAVVYVLVAVAAVSVIGWEQLSTSDAPLASVAAAVLGSPAFLVLAVIALFSTSNTVLITLVATSRMMYGMAKEQSLPRSLAKVSKKTKTPHVAIWVLMLITLVFVLIGDIEIVANLTNLFLFITFASVNLSLMVLRYKCKPNMKSKGFVCPANVGRFSTMAFLGLLTSLFMLGYVILNLIG